MSQTKIYFNPKCSKCRIALAELNERGIEPEIVEYLSHPLDRNSLETLVNSLSDPLSDVVRKDHRFSELALDVNDFQDQQSVVKLLLEHPELMQRPIIARGNRAFIARTAEAIDSSLQD